ncbi:unnamed protein product [Rhizoctonia solani]|uniref:Uncharacterized protein n=1 Tax=Rhizoctonia solani TaxID=456999 RepID=A0A8H3B7L6_9AGAM|nr:unnamed protein product [Rhizoctonia solani]
MVADFVCAEFGWLKGKNSESARVIFRPGVNRDGYFTCDRVVEQLNNAIKILKESYPEYTHVFIYDNAPSHTKRPEDAITARQMPKKSVPVFPYPVVKKGKKSPALRMEPGKLPDGRAQSFYFPDDHPNPGWFKGIAEILKERGLGHIADKPAQCRDFKCEEGKTDCCCRRALFLPLSSIRKFAARTQRFVDAYIDNKCGPEAIEWATKTFRSHRQTPAHLTFSQI